MYSQSSNYLRPKCESFHPPPTLPLPRSLILRFAIALFLSLLSTLSLFPTLHLPLCLLLPLMRSPQTHSQGDSSQRSTSTTLVSAMEGGGGEGEEEGKEEGRGWRGGGRGEGGEGIVAMEGTCRCRPLHTIWPMRTPVHSPLSTFHNLGEDITEYHTITNVTTNVLCPQQHTYVVHICLHIC